MGPEFEPSLTWTSLCDTALFTMKSQYCFDRWGSATDDVELRVKAWAQVLAQRCMLLWAPSSWLLVCSTRDKMSPDEAPERSLGGRWSFLGKDATKKGPRTEPRALLTYTRQMAGSKGPQNSFTKDWYRRKIKNLVVK